MDAGKSNRPAAGERAGLRSIADQNLGGCAISHQPHPALLQQVLDKA